MFTRSWGSPAQMEPAKDNNQDRADAPDVQIDATVVSNAEQTTIAGLPGNRTRLAGSEDKAALQLGLRPGQFIGPYCIERILGEGGLGVVYIATQTEPVKRRVALKVIKPGMDSASVIARFDAERQALAIMDHPGLAKIFDGGATDRGLPYFVMEYVDGEPMTRFCNRHDLDMKNRIKLFMKVCDAIQHAHMKGVIHRDLKPGNILVEGDARENRPIVIDFGIAKATDESLTDQEYNTMAGQMIGTPAYMSPEQAGLSTEQDIDTRADIYSLGVILYELLCASTPISEDTLHDSSISQIQKLIQDVDPPRPSQRVVQDLQSSDRVVEVFGVEARTQSKRLRGDLDWIIMKCLEKDRNRRYASANELAMDLQRYLDNEPVLAGPPSTAYRMKKFARRNRGPLVAASLVLVALVAGIITTSVLLVKLSIEGERTRQALIEANFRTYLSNITAASNLLDSRKRDLARMRLESIASIDAGDTTYEWNYLKSRLDGPILMQMEGHKGPVTGVAYIPGKGLIASTSMDRRIHLWDSMTGRSIYQMPIHDCMINCIVASHDGSVLVTADEKGRIQFWDPVRRTLESTIDPHSGSVHALAISPDDGMLAAAGEDRKITLWDLASNQSKGVLEGHEETITDLEFSRDGRTLLSSSRDDTIRIWNPMSGALERTLESTAHDFMSIAINPASDQVASGTIDGQILLWDEDGELQQLHHHDQAVTCLEFNPAGTELYSGSNDGLICRWDPGDGRLIDESIHDAPVSSIAIDHEQNRGAVGYEDRMIRVYALARPELVKQLTGPRSEVLSTALHPGGNLLATGHGDDIIRLWDLHSMELVAELDGHTGPVTALEFTRGGDVLVSGGWDARVRSWDVLSGARGDDIALEARTINDIIEVPGSGLVATAASDGMLTLVDADMKQIRSIEAHDDPITVLAVSPDSRLIATGSSDDTAIIWRVNDLKMIRELDDHESDISSIAFSNDGSMMATGSWDNDILITMLESQQEPMRISGHEEAVIHVEFSDDDSRLFTASRDGTFRVWSVKAGEELLVIPAHKEPINSVSICGQEQRVITGSDDRSIWLWESVNLGERMEEVARSRRLQEDLTEQVGQLLAAGTEGTLQERFQARFGDQDEPTRDAARACLLKMRNESK